jgi:chorismate mutase
VPRGSALSRRVAALVLALACTLAPACASSRALAPPDSAALDRLLALIVERLEVAPDVARAKWNTHAAIEDLPREQQVITTVGNSAATYGLSREDAEGFFRAQIEASKIVQRAMTTQFTADRRPPFPTVRSLDTDIRPILDRLTPEMLRALSASLPIMESAAARRMLERRRHRFAPKVPGGDRAMAVAVAPLLASASAARD